jgi:hypothetical protein
VSCKPAKASATPKVAVTMRKASSDPKLLGNVLAGESWRRWRTLLVSLMGEALTDDERAIFKDLTGREREPLERVEEFWGVIGRRGGKSRATAALVVFLACFVDHRSVIAVGERPTVLLLAQNQKQATIALSYICGIVETTPLLASLIKNRTAEALELKNGVTVEVRPASFRGLRGVTAVAIIADEIAFWYSDETGSANPDSEILSAVRPALATTGGPLIAISSPYARRGELYETFSKHFGPQGDPKILVARGASRDLNPSLPQRVVDRAMQRDPVAARSEYLAEFRSDLEQFISHEAVAACIMPGVREIEPRRYNTYHGFVDPSGGSSDSMTMAISYSDDERAVLAALREVKPPFSPEATVADFAMLLRSYGISRIRGDRWGGEFVQEQFRRHGITYEPADRSRSELYSELLPLINSRRASLLDDKRLVSQLIGLERRTSRGGKDSIDHAPGGHDDLANAAAGAVVYAVARDRRPKLVFG